MCRIHKLNAARSASSKIEKGARGNLRVRITLTKRDLRSLVDADKPWADR
jgi:hypothetical protein